MLSVRSRIASSRGSYWFLRYAKSLSRLSPTSIRVNNPSTGCSLKNCLLNYSADITAKLRSIEQTALSVRESLRGWGGPTGTSLALAGRARALQGDPDTNGEPKERPGRRGYAGRPRQLYCPTQLVGATRFH